MFGTRISQYIAENIPELEGLLVCVGKKVVQLGDYDRINALLVHNSILNDTKQSIAIYHPKDDFLDAWILLVMGLSAYKDSILRNTKLRMHDFQDGELVEFEGKVVWFKGVFTDPADGVQKFRIGYDDKYRTRDELPLQHFGSVAKYRGDRVSADPHDSKRARSTLRDAVGKLLGYQEQQVGLAGYPTFVVCSERQGLLEMLKNVSVNGIPFFKMFPSVKCTPSQRQRLGSDRHMRSPMFYFTAGLSTADDILASESGIKTMFIDAGSRAMNAASLLESIRYDYSIEDIYLLQHYDRLDTAPKLESSLGFKIWLWGKADFAKFAQRSMPQTTSSHGCDSKSDDTFSALVDNHNRLGNLLSLQNNRVVEVSYPSPVTTDMHRGLQSFLHWLLLSADRHQNSDLSQFLVLAYGLLNRLFQSPASPRAMDGRTFEEELKELQLRASYLPALVLPLGYHERLKQFIKDLSLAASALEGYKLKLRLIANIVSASNGLVVCIQVKNRKYADELQQALPQELKNLSREGGNGAAQGMNYFISSSHTHSVKEYDKIVWTYKPSLGLSIVTPVAEENIFLLYPFQAIEFKGLISMSTDRLAPFMSKEYRAALLNVPVEMLEGVKTETSNIPARQHHVPQGFTDFDDFFESAHLRLHARFSNQNRADWVEAKRVLFNDGLIAFFQVGARLRVLDETGESIVTKAVSTLLVGERVVFLKNSKRTIFDELVEYYGHKPDIIYTIKLSECWRKALVDFCSARNLKARELRTVLAAAGLKRSEVTIGNWLDGSTICPLEDNYLPVDIIASVTGNTELLATKEEVKDAARKIHSLRIKIGHYLARRITQSAASAEHIIDDPVLRNKLDEILSHVQIAEVQEILEGVVKVSADVTNRPLGNDEL